MAKDQPKQEAAAEKPKKKIAFWDTGPAFVLFFGIIVVARFLVLEPFKIPSGSMEPTLIGHVDYGDRIFTNLLAYASPGYAFGILGGLGVLLALSAAGSWFGYRGLRRAIYTAIPAILLLGGGAYAFLAHQRGALAGEPERFDIVVFKYRPEWANAGELASPKNYIKRLVGLPGDRLIISGGDLFLDQAGKEEIVRKWQHDPQLQESLWQPIARSSFRQVPLPEIADPNDPFQKMERVRVEKENRYAFPWDVEGGTAERVRNEETKTWTLEVTGPATLSYAYPVTNVYVKMGRWPFRHIDCPMSKLEKTSPDGIVFFDPRFKKEYSRPYLPNSWSGVVCPHCRQRQFPLLRESGLHGQTEIVPDMKWNISTQDQAGGEDGPEALQESGDTSAGDGPPFFYGGHEIVGDLKIEMDFEVLASGGGMFVEIGNNRHRAAWSLALGGDAPTVPSDKSLHAVPDSPSLNAGRHTLVLAWVDGTLFAMLDGSLRDPVPFEVRPAGAATVESVARVALSGNAKVRITRLDLYRDLYHTTTLDRGHGTNPISANIGEDRRKGRLDFHEDRNRYTATIGQNEFMVLGDNSPSSTDSRVWGFVPREDLKGRAAWIWWPPSRWRTMR